MQSEIHVAVIGAGYWGTNLIRVLHQTDGLWLKAVCDLQTDRLQDVKLRYPELVVTSSWDRILDDESINGVFIATPPATHYQLARAALAAGKHVWVEKPLALSYQDGHELVTLAQATKRALFVDETFLYDPLVQHVRDMITTDTIGKIHHAYLARTGMGRIRRDSNVWWNSAPHDLSLLRYLLAGTAVRRLSVSGHAFLQPELEDVVTATLQLAGNISATMYLSWLFPEKQATLMLVGECGMIGYEGRFEKRAVTHYEYKLGGTAAQTPAALTQANLIPIEQCNVVGVIQGERSEPLLLACAAFRDYIVTGAVPPSDGTHSLSTLAVLEAGARSLVQQGAWIDMPSTRSE